MFIVLFLSSLIALATFYGVGVAGPLQVFRVNQAVPLYTEAALTAYNRAATEYVQKQQAGTLEDGAIAPEAPRPIQPMIWQGLDRNNLLRAAGVAVLASLVGTYGLTAMAKQFRMPKLPAVHWRVFRRDRPDRDHRNGLEATHHAREAVEAGRRG